MQKIEIQNNALYHVYNRGLDKTDLFQDNSDYLRFVKEIHHFNNINFKPDELGFQNRYQGSTLEKDIVRKELVDILAWCLMPNHYHMVLRQKIGKGISKFMQRLGTGYTMYTNIKYERSGHIFQGRFKIKIVENDKYLQHLTRYIHLNPLDIYDPKWKRQGVKNIEENKKILLQYPWSSLKDYLQIDNIYPLTSPSFKEFLFTNNPSGYAEFLWDWLENGLPSKVEPWNYEKID